MGAKTAGGAIVRTSVYNEKDRLWKTEATAEQAVNKRKSDILETEKAVALIKVN